MIGTCAQIHPSNSWDEAREGMPRSPRERRTQGIRADIVTSEFPPLRKVVVPRVQLHPEFDGWAKRILTAAGPEGPAATSSNPPRAAGHGPEDANGRRPEILVRRAAHSPRSRRTARSRADPSNHQPHAHRVPRFLLVAHQPRPPFPSQSQSSHRRHPMLFSRLQKHEARRFSSPGFAGNSKSTIDSLFHGSPGDDAIHDEACEALRMAGPRRGARRDRSVDVGAGHHVSRKNLVYP
jgi:hypothetical protein